MNAQHIIVTLSHPTSYIQCHSNHSDHIQCYMTPQRLHHVHPYLSNARNSQWNLNANAMPNFIQFKHNITLSALLCHSIQMPHINNPHTHRQNYHTQNGQSQNRTTTRRATTSLLAPICLNTNHDISHLRINRKKHQHTISDSLSQKSTLRTSSTAPSHSPSAAIYTSPHPQWATRSLTTMERVQGQ